MNADTRSWYTLSVNGIDARVRLDAATLATLRATGHDPQPTTAPCDLARRFLTLFSATPAPQGATENSDLREALGVTAISVAPSGAGCGARTGDILVQRGVDSTTPRQEHR